jgi:dienelactone hydrolase
MIGPEGVNASSGFFYVGDLMTECSYVALRRFINTVVLLVIALIASQAVAESQLQFNTDEVNISALREREFNAQLKFEKHLYRRDKISGDLYSYKSDGLKVYALINTPTSPMPKAGFPVLIYGHGFHPEPKNYGVTEAGVVSRPGDYYRGIPERYAQEGYLVITPDYRGHNISEGFEYTQRNSLSSSYYAVDVLHLISAIDGFANANSQRLFYAGHSMGGDVGLKALLASNKVKAASLWSPAVGTTRQRALYYGRYYDDDANAAVDKQKLREYNQTINEVYSRLPSAISPEEVDAINYLQYLDTPLIVHHSRGDSSVPYQWAENLIVEMNELDKEFLFYPYDSANHLFKGDNLETAFVRDLEFFNNH